MMGEHITAEEAEELAYEEAFLQEIAHNDKPKALYYGDDEGRAE